MRKEPMVDLERESSDFWAATSAVDAGVAAALHA
jgi:hypothetical protein